MPERVVYGIHAASEALRARRGEVSLLVQAGTEAGGGQRGRADEGVLSLCREARRLGLAPVEVPRGELDRLALGGLHQGVVVLCGEYVYAELADVLALGCAKDPLLLLVLDGVTDPQNLGALVRSVLVLGGHGVVIPQDRAAPVTPAVVKASAGATEILPIVRVTNLVRALQQMKEAGIWLYGAVAGHGAGPPWGLDLRGAAGLVLGSEGRGLRPLVQRTCDGLIEVPMAGGLQGASLNVSAAGAALLYEALRQRHSVAQRSSPPAS